MKTGIKIIAITLITKIMVIMVGCADHRLDGMVDDRIYLLNYYFQDIDMYNFGEYTSAVVVCKGGIGSMSADVELSLNQTLIVMYNNVHGTSYQQLPANVYALSETKFHFGEDDVRKVMTITYDTKAIGELPNRDSYVIPLQMKVNDGVEIDEGKQTLLVRPKYIEPYIFFPHSQLALDMPISAANPNTEHKFEVAINYRNLIDPFAWRVEFELEIADHALLDDYNATNNKNYQMLPTAAFSFNKDAWAIEKGRTLRDVPIQFFKKELVNAAGDYIFGDYALPVQISSVSNWYIDAGRNTQFMLFPFYPSAFDASGWKVISWNTDITMDDVYAQSTLTPDGMLRGTGWRSKWNDPLPALPYYFVFDMLTPKTITHINIHFPTGSPENEARGNLRSGTFEISDDSENWTTIDAWNRGSNNIPRVLSRPIPEQNQMKARYLRLQINEAINYLDGSMEKGARMDIQRLEVIGFE